LVPASASAPESVTRIRHHNCPPNSVAKLSHHLRPLDFYGFRAPLTSGNVFTDLGFGPGEAAVMGLRADLMVGLRVLVKEEGWTQAQAAERFAIAQSRVSDDQTNSFTETSMPPSTLCKPRCSTLPFSKHQRNTASSFLS
jgi:predicted XRE-type DNA-binding protein